MENPLTPGGFPAEPNLQLTGGGCRCTGILEVKWMGRWSRVCRDSVSVAGADGVCQRLGCGPPIAGSFQLMAAGGKELRAPPLWCQGPAANVAGCRWTPVNCTEHVVLACSGEPGPPPRSPASTGTIQPRPGPSLLISEPVKTTTEPPPPPPTTTPEPAGKTLVPVRSPRTAAMAKLGHIQQSKLPPHLINSFSSINGAIKLQRWWARGLNNGKKRRPGV